MQGCLVDSNVWVAATFPTHLHHIVARQVIQDAAASRPLIWCRSTEQSYLRLMTTASIHRVYMGEGGRISNRTALGMLDQLRALPHVVERAEPHGVTKLWHDMAASSLPSPRIWMDAYLAAWAIAADVPLATLDAGFMAFRSHGLKLQLLA